MHSRRGKTHPQNVKNYNKIQYKKRKIHNDEHPIKNYHLWKKEGLYNLKSRESVNRNRFRMTDDSINRQATTNIPVGDKSIIMMKRGMEGIKRTQIELEIKKYNI